MTVQSTISGSGAARTARHAAHSPASEGLARFGYIAKGLVYLIIGVLAGRVAIGDGGKTTDNRGALQAIYHEPFGRVLLSIVIIGLVGYALWCFLRAFLDVDGKGADAKGILARVGYALVGVSYSSLAFAALRLVTGSGSTGKSTDTSAKDWTALLLGEPYGKALVIAFGVLIIGIALYLFYYACSAHFMKSLTGLSGRMRTWVSRLGRIGYGAQGVVFAEVGIFLIVAARQQNAHAAKGIGGSLAQLAHEPYGHLALGIVALGLIAYGLYSFAQARFRRISTI